MKFYRMILSLSLVALILAACGGSTTEPTEQAPLTSSTYFGNVATASGKVVPDRWSTLSFEAGGRLTWLAAEGAEVKAGEALARLDDADRQHAVAQAQAALVTAQAQLAQAKAGPTQAEINQAEAAVAVAEGNLAASRAALVQAETSSDPTIAEAEASLSSAQAALLAAQAEVARSQAELGQLLAGGRPEEIAFYEAKLAEAEALLFQPTHIHDELIRHDILGEPEEEARHVMFAAQAVRDAARANLELAQAGPTVNEVASASAMVNAAKAQVTVAKAGVEAAEAALEKARAAQADITVAQAQVEVSEGQLAQSKAQLEQVIAGSTPEEIAVLEAQVAQSEAALEQAQTALLKATLVAPFDGTVGAVYPHQGEVVAAGAPIVALGDIGVLRVETTDLNEVDAAGVAVGSPATLTFDALPDRSVKGKVLRLAPMASVSQGGTNFTALIEIVDTPEGLRWGMTAFADIEIER